MMCLGVGVFASILFGTLCASWTCMSISYTKLGRFSFIIFSNGFPISCSFSSLSGTAVIWILESLKLSHRLLILSLFLWILFSYCSDGCFFASLCSKSIWFSAFSTLLLCPCKLFFTSISVSFVSDWILFIVLRSSLSSLSVLITVFWTLYLIDCLSTFCLVLFLEFCSVLSIRQYFFVFSF